ncbi:hypothetical protein FYJ28_06440 [Arthrobacter sp. BL-252-APC-1A]|uniref:hypothetical protein n=1 Tax=Arthrobacter sp. BL-252-APC-1A TaxID=2606622 RepID=UPI0012B222D1|nr:hypothetical protein [Arthrobacter sp. BL-252-APC-1A]MSR98462.1 hypothetical protein [Arthrobacter sp. BL-252-APC-1A]
MTALQVIPVLVLWSVVGGRLLGLAFGWKPGILGAVFLVALAATLNIDPVYLAVDRYLGGWNLLNLIVHLLMGIGMTDLSRLLLRVTGRARRIKALICVGAVLAAAQMVLLLISNTQGSAASFTDTFGDQPTIALYQGTFFAWFGMISGYTGVETLRRDRAGESRAFRIGFNLLSAGCFVGVAAAALKMFEISTEIRGGGENYDDALILGYRILLAAMVTGFAVGFILPTIGRIRSALRARAVRRSDLDALRPIVRRLMETSEGQRSMRAASISLESRTSKTQLYRWFIFIGDIRVLDPKLLSPQENRTIDEIGTRIEHHHSPARNTAASGV